MGHSVQLDSPNAADSKVLEHRHDSDNMTEADESQTKENQYPPLRVVIPTVLCIYMAVFLTALDRTIIGVAIPAISNEFQSFGDISWYEAAFLLTLCTFQLPMGKIFKYTSAKWTLVGVVIIFEVGSIICAAAPSSNALIVGRAICGIGAAGSVVGAQVNIRDLVPLSKVPKYQGFIGAVFGLASIMGPLVGGAFTSNITWRWCFWISVPIAGVILIGLIFVLPATSPPSIIEGTPLEMTKKFDPLGNLLLLPGVVCLLLAVQWGGIVYPWNSSRVIALLVIGPVLMIAFVVTQFWTQENGTVPPRIFRQRSIEASTIVTLGLGGPLIIASFYLPIWFQAVKGLSAGSAGVRLLPYFLSTVVFVMISGIAISKLGYYTPWLIAGCAALMIGTGLLTTLEVDSGAGKWVGYQIIIGAGMGLSLQQGFNAVQTVLTREDISTGITILAFAQGFGGTILVSVSQTVLSTTLKSQLAKSLPEFDASAISSMGATDIRNMVPVDKLPIILDAYNAGISNVFYVALAASCLAFTASLFVEWRTVEPKDEPLDTAKETKV